jgi:hypothetical protein
MKRLIAVSLGLIVGVSALRADEIEWKAVKQEPAAKTISAKEEPKAVEPVAEGGPILLGPTWGPVDPPAGDTKPKEEPLPQPRPLPVQIKPAKPAPTMIPPSSSAMRTLTIMSEGETPTFDTEPTRDAGPRFYARAELLLWFTKLMNAPPLVRGSTVVPPGPVLPPGFGLPGDPFTQILYGNGPIGDPFHMGARFSAGAWLDSCQTCGVDASCFFLGRNTDTVVFASPQFPVIFRPFIQANPPGGPNFQIVAFPPGFTQGGLPFPDQTGSLTIDTATGLWGADVNAKECLCCSHNAFGGYRVDLFAGFRYLDLDDRLSITENLVLGANNAAGFVAGTRAIVNDQFSTHDQFYGGQIGANFEYTHNRFSLDGRASVALGATHEVILINGSQQVTPPGAATQFFTGGLLALRSNSGRFTTGRFGFAPEFTLNAGYLIAPRLKVFAGYNFLLWTPVARAAEQIDPVLDISQIPNFANPPPPPVVPTRPVVPFTQNAFWAQGVQFGVELRW